MTASAWFPVGAGTTCTKHRRCSGRLSYNELSTPISTRAPAAF